MVNKLGKMRFLIAIVAFFLLIVQAVMGIMMFVDSSDNVPMNGQAMAGQPADRGTGASGDSSKSSESAGEADETAPNDASGNLGRPPQGWADGSGTKEEMPGGGGFQRGNSLAREYIDFYQGAGGLATSIIILLIGGAGIATAILTRKTAA
ncbi:hypothetical protein [Peribacillus sp. FSL E2-0218]|uniref:hypothetical protein n=1 Tax=Peribacillus sp. FSL E2-0218 TaxID=2921364 RepID=UPI0030EE3566